MEKEEKHSVKDRIKETKEHGILIECDIIGVGTPEDPYSPEVFKDGCYCHLEGNDMNFTTMKCKVWISKKRTKKDKIDHIKGKYKVLEETKD